MQRSVSHPTPAGARVVFRPLRLLAASAALALAGGLLQTAAAAPQGVHGSPGTLPAMGQMGSLLMAHPRQMERLFDGIGASAEQRAQIQQILRLQALAQHDRASRRMVRALLDMSRVLTAEQRQALAEQMAQHRAALQRHRAESEAAPHPKR